MALKLKNKSVVKRDGYQAASSRSLKHPPVAHGPVPARFFVISSVIAIVLGLASGLIGHKAGYQRGQDDGYIGGYSNGYSDGKSYGYSEGKSAGYGYGDLAGYAEGFEDARVCALKITNEVAIFGVSSTHINDCYNR